MGFFKSTNKKISKRPLLYRMSRSLIDWFKLGAYIVSVVALLVGSYEFFLKSDYFNIKKVKVTGNLTKISPIEVKQIAQIPFGKNIFLTNLYEISANIRRFQWIREVKIRRDFPDGLSLLVEEYQPMAILELSGNADPSKAENFFLSHDGIIFKKISKSDNNMDYPIIRGIEKSKLTVHPRYYKSKILKLMEFISEFNRQQNGADKIATNESKKNLLSSKETTSIKEVELDALDQVKAIVSITQNGQTYLSRVFFGNVNQKNSISTWHDFSKIMHKKQMVYRDIDLHAEGKVYARNSISSKSQPDAAK